jgi:hypothetical protein
MRRSRSNRVLAGCAVLALGLAGGGCVTEGPPPKPLPREIPTQPEGIHPDRVLSSAGAVLTDTDRNGYVDGLGVTVYLFAKGYDLPITATGSFEFKLVEAGGAESKVICTWVLDPSATKAAIQKFIPGPGYHFDLSLLDRPGGDKLATQRAELWTRFLPVGAAPIETRSPLTVNLGAAPGGPGT